MPTHQTFNQTDYFDSSYTSNVSPPTTLALDAYTGGQQYPFSTAGSIPTALTTMAPLIAGYPTPDAIQNPGDCVLPSGLHGAYPNLNIGSMSDGRHQPQQYGSMHVNGIEQPPTMSNGYQDPRQYDDMQAKGVGQQSATSNSYQQYFHGDNLHVNGIEQPTALSDSYRGLRLNGDMHTKVIQQQPAVSDGFQPNSYGTAIQFNDMEQPGAMLNDYQESGHYGMGMDGAEHLTGPGL
jgi:hypothetical protein